jgi:hypothetical protein
MNQQEEENISKRLLKLEIISLTLMLVLMPLNQLFVLWNLLKLR